MTDVKFTDNSEKVLEKLKKGKKLALEAIGLKAEGYAKDLTPVVTGRLRNSITWATKDNEGRSHSYGDNEGHSYTDQIGTGADDSSVYIGTNVEYALGIETGTHRKAGPAHMLQQAATGHSDEYKKLAAEALESVGLTR